MSQTVQAYVNGEQIAWTDFCAGDPPGLRRVFFSILMSESDDYDDMAVAYVTRNQVQQTIAELINRELPVPDTLEFLYECLKHDTVKITVY